jgi:hypothetical protein
MARNTEIKTTRTISKIIDRIKEYSQYPDESSLLKTACEVYELSREDALIADNMKSYWIEKADGAA